MYQEVDHQLTIAKDPDRTPEGWPISDKLGQALQGIPEGKKFDFVVGAPSIVLSSSPVSFYTICVQDNKTTYSMPFLGAINKLCMFQEGFGLLSSPGLRGRGGGWDVTPPIV